MHRSCQTRKRPTPTTPNILPRYFKLQNECLDPFGSKRFFLAERTKTHLFLPHSTDCMTTSTACDTHGDWSIKGNRAGGAAQASDFEEPLILAQGYICIIQNACLRPCSAAFVFGSIYVFLSLSLSFRLCFWQYLCSLVFVFSCLALICLVYSCRVVSCL